MVTYGMQNRLQLIRKDDYDVLFRTAAAGVAKVKLSWTKDTRITTQFNLPPSNCRRHFNFAGVVNGSRRRALGFTWREIDYTFSSS